MELAITDKNFPVKTSPYIINPNFFQRFNIYLFIMHILIMVFFHIKTVFVLLIGFFFLS